MKIKLLTVMIIAVLIAVSLPMAFDNNGTVKGWDWIWTPFGWEHPTPESWPAFPNSTETYCCCSHTDIIWTGGPFDCWTSIAVSDVTYDIWSPPYDQNHGFIYAHWWFQSASGGVYPQFIAIPLFCTLGVDNQYSGTHECWDIPTYQTYGQFSGFMAFWDYNNNPDNPFDPRANTIQGSASAYFYNDLDDIFLVQANVIPSDLIIAHD
jgi:hypothetical protein